MMIIGKVFSVSINELLAGQFLTDEEFRQKAEENVVAVSKDSIFSFEKKKAYNNYLLCCSNFLLK